MIQGPPVAVAATTNPVARPLIVDIGILGGVVISNVLFDRIIRPNFHPFMITLYRNAYPCWIRTSHTVAQVCIGTVEGVHIIRNRTTIGLRVARVKTGEGFRIVQQFIHDKKTDVIRILTSRLLPFFLEKARNIYLWTITRIERPAFGNRQLGSKNRPTRLDRRHLERASFRYIPEMDVCDLDDCNEDGLIHAYEKSDSPSDTESEDLWSHVGDTEEIGDTEMDANGQTQWGTIDVTSFDPTKNAKSSTPVKLTFPNIPKEVTEDTSQLQQSEAKVAALEAQLNEMKAMIALILENQNKTMVPDVNKTIVAPTEVNESKPVVKAPIPPPPPPPPAPPMPDTPLSSLNTSMIKLKVGRKSSSNENGLNSTHPIPNNNANAQKKAEPEVKSLTDVLRGLSNVKLRPTPRSPGGTPLKRQKTLSPNDAKSLLERALKKRFACTHSPSDSEHEDYGHGSRRSSTNNKENLGGGGMSEEDSFDSSPLFYKPRKSGGGLPKRPSLFPPEVVDLKTEIIPEVNESGLDEDSNSTLKLGLHLLKPTISNRASLNILKQANRQST